MIDLDELERLEKEATPGPWRQQRDLSPDGDNWPLIFSDAPDMLRMACVRTYHDVNANYLVGMRNALPALIRELRAARECVAKLRSGGDDCEELRDYDASISDRYVHLGDEACK